MGKTLIMLGWMLGELSIAVLYLIFVIALLDADEWWKKVVVILVMVGLPIVMMLIGGIICGQSG